MFLVKAVLRQKSERLFASYSRMAERRIFKLLLPSDIVQQAGGADGIVSDGTNDDAPSFFQEYKYKLEHLYDMEIKGVNVNRL